VTDRNASGQRGTPRLRLVPPPPPDVAAAITEAIAGFDRAVALLPRDERLWRGRLLRCRWVLAHESALRHLEPLNPEGGES
jgi:hypothetical protein